MKKSNAVHLVLLLSSAISVNAGAASFREVRNVIFNPSPVAVDAESKQEIDVYASGALPRYEVTTSRLVKNGVDIMKAAAQRTIKDRVDYYPRLDKLVHSNGICFAGEWTITESNPYSGLFKKGTRVPVIARVSTATSNTEAGAKRGFGLAVKLFPTQDPNENVQTASIFTVDVLSGAKNDHFMDTALTNEAPVGINLGLIELLLKISSAFKAADEQPTFRQVYEVSEAGLARNEAVKTPHWLRFKPAPGQGIVNEKDFRNELDL
ncbi:MAG: hypothetical protein EOP06_09055, partial [Proteobacteria bacterium]